MSKVKYGLKNVHIFPITKTTEGVEEYGEVIKVPGAVSMSMEPIGEVSSFYADNTVYYSMGSSAGYEGEFEFAMIPDAVLEKCLGYKRDKNHALYEDNAPKASNFAIAYQFEHDDKQSRHLFYNVSAGKPKISGNTTEDKTEPDTETLPMTAGANGKGVIKVRLETGDTGYDTFFTAPYKIVDTPSI
ncbi:MAG: phage tail protein [Clostridia bacterium]|nr:phage tail protein [Clostridiales bacterium]MDU7504495.1 phage tail protein [Clostridia bacterium]